MSPVPPRLSTWSSLARVAGPPALVMVLLLSVTASRYGPHGDELYFRMLPPAWWYVDQPPLTVWLSHLAALLGHGIWIQRIPAIVAAGTGVVLAACFPRVLVYDEQIQRWAAWPHAGAVYPLLVGHVFLTSSIDLVVWQAVVLFTLIAVQGQRKALVWAGVVAGLGCWNKLLVVFLVAALVVGVLVVDDALLRTRQAVIGACAFICLAGPQIVAQVLHGSPMSQVSGGLIAVHGGVNRVLVVPLLFAFLGPPLLGLWWRGLLWRPSDGRARLRLPVLGVCVAILIVWNLAFPAQPYYAVAALLPALALGWGPAREAGGWSRRHRWQIVAANGVVSVLLSLPVVPVDSPAFAVVARVVPVNRDQVGLSDAARSMNASRGGPDVGILADHYALAGALRYYGPKVGVRTDQVSSGHNGLWEMGPPTTDTVLLVGEIARTHRSFFRSCRDAGELRIAGGNPFGLDRSPMAVCSGPVPSWAAVWPSFRRLGG